MADDVQMEIEITVPASVEAAGDMPDKWALGLTTNATRINDRRLEKIGDEGAFQSKVAVPSSAGFSPIVDGAFVSKRGRNQGNIIRAQYKNLTDSYNQWNDKLALSFATVDGVAAKRFKDQVNNSKDNWATAVSQKTLRATGDKIRGTYLGQAGFWMVGDYMANAMVNNVNIVAGAPYDGIYPGLQSTWKAILMQQLTAGLMRILDSDMLAAEILIVNTILQDLGIKFRDTLVAPVKQYVVGGGAADSILQFEYADPTLLLRVRIVTV